MIFKQLTHLFEKVARCAKMSLFVCLILIEIFWESKLQSYGPVHSDGRQWTVDYPRALYDRTETGLSRGLLEQQGRRLENIRAHSNCVKHNRPVRWQCRRYASLIRLPYIQQADPPSRVPISTNTTEKHLL